MRKGLYSCDHIFIFTQLWCRAYVIDLYAGSSHHGHAGGVVQQFLWSPEPCTASLWPGDFMDDDMYLHRYMYIELCSQSQDTCISWTIDWNYTHNHPITCTLLPLSHLIFGSRWQWYGCSFYPKAQALLGMLLVHRRCKMFHPFSLHTVSAQVCSLFSAGKTPVMYIH